MTAAAMSEATDSMGGMTTVPLIAFVFAGLAVAVGLLVAAHFVRAWWRVTNDRTQIVRSREAGYDLARNLLVTGAATIVVVVVAVMVGVSALAAGPLGL